MARLERARYRLRISCGPEGVCLVALGSLSTSSTDRAGESDISRSSIKCGHNCKPSLCAFRYVRTNVVDSSVLSQVLTIISTQTVRSNEQMMQSMKGATMLLGSMNRQMNLPALQRIAMEFERENEVMDERQEMMDDAIDEATGMEGEEEEGEDIVKEVLDEIGVDLGSAVRFPVSIQVAYCVLTEVEPAG